MFATLSALTIYPVKSCAGLALETAHVQPRGLAHDRRWMLVDAQSGRFISAREVPQLLHLQAHAESGSLHLTAPGLAARRVIEPEYTTKDVQVWDDQVTALIADPASNDALSTWLNRAVALVFMSDAVRRSTDPRYATELGQSVSFADGFPMLLISTASLAELNRRLQDKALATVTMARFRPNFVVDGELSPHIEDSWSHIRIGEGEFDLVKPCTRCVLTTIDPALLTRDPNNEPLRTLLEYRRSDKGVTFGMNLIPRSSAKLKLGDQVSVISARPPG